MAIAAGIRAARMGQEMKKALEYEGNCKICGIPMKASHHQNFPWVCKGCGHEFCKKHGVYYTCFDCLNAFPPEESRKLKNALKGGMITYHVLITLSVTLEVLFVVGMVFPYAMDLLLTFLGLLEYYSTAVFIMITCGGFFWGLCIAVGFLYGTRNRAIKAFKKHAPVQQVQSQRCKKCGGELVGITCFDCGARECPRCKAINTDLDALFCKECGGGLL